MLSFSIAFYRFLSPSGDQDIEFFVTSSDRMEKNDEKSFAGKYFREKAKKSAKPQKFLPAKVSDLKV